MTALQSILDTPKHRRRAVKTLNTASAQWAKRKSSIHERTPNVVLQDSREYAGIAAQSCAALADLYERADKPYRDTVETHWDTLPWHPATVHLTATGDCALGPIYTPSLD